MLRRAVVGVGSIVGCAMLVACGGSQRLVHLAGTVERTTIELALPVSETLVASPVEVGQKVEAGRELLQFDTTVAAAEADAADALARSAEAVRVQAERDLARAKSLSGARAMSAADLDHARSQFDQATALASERAATLATARKRLTDLTVRSPVEGVVDELPFDVGERVPAGSIVAVVVSAGKPWVRVWLPAEAVAGTAAGAKAAIEVEGIEGVLHGTVRDVARAPAFTPHYALTERESAHLVYHARVWIDDAPPDLRPGLAARVTLRVGVAGADRAGG